MPRMVHRGKEKPSARGVSAPALLALWVRVWQIPQPECAAKSSQELDGAIIRLLWSVYHILL